MLVYCPSDAEMDQKIDDGKDDAGNWCYGYAARGGGDCARAVDSSYAYWGWTFDRADCAPDPLKPVSDFPTLGMAAGLLGVPANMLSTPVSSQVGWALDQLFEGYLALDESVPGGSSKADSDVDVGEKDPGAGNGGGDSIYRLREGVERFMITDINNPAASAMAQSEIWIMSDQLATNPSAYNHIPGGANVLYMDGHVAFLRYGKCEVAPCNEPMAVLSGILTHES
jgi:prepilin-type processing-associated H-X9-DG protein